MRLSRFSIAALAPAILMPTCAAHAQVKATIRDRLDQIFETFIGDPAAGVDIDMKHVLDKWRSLKPKPLETLSIDDARRQPTPIMAADVLAGDDHKPLLPYELAVRQITIPGPAGPMPAQVYVPAASGSGPAPAGSEAASGGKPAEGEPTGDKQGEGKADEARPGALPVVVFFHGGGFVTDNAAGREASARAIAGTSHSIVVTPNYRLAPEARFPAAQEDCAAAYKWIIANAASFGGDAARIALAGEGAGALLAADTAIEARDAKLPKARALILIAPSAGTNLTTNSWLEDSAARPWNKTAVIWALDLYLPQQSDRNDPRIDLVGKADVHDLPPTTIVTAEVDPLRSDGERLGGKLKRVTVPVSMRDYPGVTHDFFGMGQVVEKAAVAQRYVADQLKKAFEPPPEPALALQNLGIAPYVEARDPSAPPVDAIKSAPPVHAPRKDR